MGINPDGRGLLTRIVVPDGRVEETWVPSYDGLRQWVKKLDPSGRHEIVTDAFEVATPAYFSRCLAEFERKARLQTRSEAAAPGPVVLRLQLPVGPKRILEADKTLPPEESAAEALGEAAELAPVNRPVDEWKPVELQGYASAPSAPPKYHSTHSSFGSFAKGKSPNATAASAFREAAEASTDERPRSPSTPGGGGARFIQEEWNYDVVARGEELLESLVDGNLPRVDHLLSGCWDVSVRHAATGDTALHLASKIAISPLGLRILEHGSDVQALNAARETPLLLAVNHQRCYQLASALLKKQADPNAVASDGTTPLIRAAGSAGTDPSRLVELLLSNRANPNFLGPNGASALHLAAKRGDTRTAAVLLAAGANPKLTVDGEWVTPLYLASIHGHPGVVEVLSDFGAAAGV
jgi:hypothetical protein